MENLAETVELPLAVYGKPADAQDAGGYRFLVRHPDFSAPSVDRGLRRMVTGLEWNPSTDVESYPDVFGVLALEKERSLVARFSDVGRDAAGRPHSLRVSCVLWEGEVFRSLLDAAVWEKAEMLNATSLRLPRPGGSLIEDVAEGGIALAGDGATFACAEGVRVM